jgi:predicted nucleotidyltransferase
MTSFMKFFPNPTFVDILVLFLMHPEQERYQSSIVTSTGKALMQVQRILKRLEETGLITKVMRGNRAYYRANRKHPAFEDIKRVLLKTVVIGEALKTALIPLKKKVHFAFIFGSIARSEETADSDIDLFLVGDLKLREMATFLGSFRDQVGREINPVIYPVSEFKEKLKQKNNFLIEVLNSPKIWLMGDESEFAKMGQ